MKSPLLFLLLLVGTWNFGAPLSAQEAAQNVSVEAGIENRINETKDFRDVKAKVFQMVKKYGSKKVLVVFDIDNTLLAMNQDLGSDQWFNWQEGKLNKRKKEKIQGDDPELVAKDFPGLLKVQRTLFELSGMHPPQQDLPEIVGDIQRKGVKTILLTSRGPVNRSATERELKKNHYNFESSSFPITEKRSDFFPFDRERPFQHGLNPEIIKEIKSLRKASYSKGIFMTAGQHKGFMLRTLIARDPNNPEYQAIIFVDDHKKHCERVLDAYNKSSIDVFTFNYSKESDNVKRFKESDKSDVSAQWDSLNFSINEIFQRH